MVLSPACRYDPDPPESGMTCSLCGRPVMYLHTVIMDGSEMEIGRECVVRLRQSGAIDKRLPLRGRYDWKISAVRERARSEWIAAHPLLSE